jgi:site-specific DNA recombinase
MALQRKMEAIGLTDPYVKVAEPPDDCPRLRRHKHGRYRFDPLPGTGII